MSRMHHPFEGILWVDKPSGCTSHDVVDRLRRKLKMRQIGHAGTLDPMATGLLVMLVGKATKASNYLMSLNKEYEGVIKLGETTDSHDADGMITASHPVPIFTRDEIETHMKVFLGDQYQTPPMFSAKKIHGVPLYKIARKGESVEREPRFIHVSQFTLLKWDSPELHFRLGCSKGTYVRTMAHDLGENLKCGGHLIALRRTKSGDATIQNAIPLETLESMSLAELKTHLLPVYEAIPSSAL